MILKDDGWIQNARQEPSPHQDARPNDEVNLLVAHGISLPSGVFGGDAIVQLFCGTLDCQSAAAFNSLTELKVSAHFLICRDGELIQFVPCHRRAWHAGESQWRGQSQCNDFSIGVELEGTDTTSYAPRQYDKLIKLFFALTQKYTPLYVVGHEHIAPSRKTDPGKTFEWDFLFNKIGKQHDGRDART